MGHQCPRRRSAPGDRPVLLWGRDAPGVEGAFAFSSTMRGLCRRADWARGVWSLVLQVPVEPPSNAVHSSGAQGVAYIRLLVEPKSLASVAAQLTSVIGEAPRSDTAGSEYTWVLEVPSGTRSAEKPRLILSAPANDHETDNLGRKGPGIFEVGFSVGRDGFEWESRTPYGKIVWLRSS